MGMLEAVHLLRRQVDADDDPSVGQARQDESNESNSLSGLVSTLTPVLIIAVIMTAIFLVLRRSQERQYSPRSYLGSLRAEERSAPLPKTLFGWIPAMNKIPDTYVLQHNSLDGYFLLRFLKITIVICFVGCCITWPVLFPVNITGGIGKKQLDMLTMANVRNPLKYYAHAGVAWIFIAFVFFMVTRESIYYINLRQAYLLSPLYSHRISSRTVLISSVPDGFANEAKIRRMFGSQLKNVWIATQTKDLEEKVEERNKVAMKLEAAETKLIKLAHTAHLKSIKKGGQSDEGAIAHGDISGESGSAAARWISPKQRPTHKLKPLIGKKVDTINWCRSELQRLIPQVLQEQDLHRSGNAKTSNTVMVEFYNQTDAQAAYQMVSHHQPLHMSPKVIGFHPEEVVWSNTGITWKTRMIRNIACIGAAVVTIIFWSIPVAIVGIISNIDALIDRVPFLEFIRSIPDVILGVVTGLLPTIMLAVLIALLPVWFRFLAKTAGLPTLSQIELRLQTSYFWFQVIQVFLVTTLSSAVSKAIVPILNDPGSVTSLLASNLPLASNFYINYFILQGLAFASGRLLQLVGLILFKILGSILDKTPRKAYNRWVTLSALGWGTVFPVISNLAVIAITYSCIAPLILGFATVGLYLFYFAYRYNLLYVNTGNVDTKGLVYPRALQHILVGCYLSIICLIGLFGIKAASGPLVLMVILLIFCVLYHVSLNQALNPLLYYLPRSLELEEEHLLQAEAGAMPSGTDGNGTSSEKHGVNGTQDATTTDKGLPAPPPHKKPGMFAKFFKPHIYTDYATMRRLVPRNFAPIHYPDDISRGAYHHPAINDQPPILWVPRDAVGVSRQECAHTSPILPMTDEGAYYDDKGKLVVVKDETAPIFEQKIYY